MNNLVSAGIVEAYPPLVDKKGSYTAQFEHVSWGSPSRLRLVDARNMQYVLTWFTDNPDSAYGEGSDQQRRGLLGWTDNTKVDFLMTNPQLTAVLKELMMIAAERNLANAVVAMRVAVT